MAPAGLLSEWATEGGSSRGTDSGPRGRDLSVFPVDTDWAVKAQKAESSWIAQDGGRARALPRPPSPHLCPPPQPPRPCELREGRPRKGEIRGNGAGEELRRLTLI